MKIKLLEFETKLTTGDVEYTIRPIWLSIGGVTLSEQIDHKRKTGIELDLKPPAWGSQGFIAGLHSGRSNYVQLSQSYSKQADLDKAFNDGFEVLDSAERLQIAKALVDCGLASTIV